MIYIILDSLVQHDGPVPGLLIQVSSRGKPECETFEGIFDIVLCSKHMQVQYMQFEN
jgi:hypothetical protein